VWCFIGNAGACDVYSELPVELYYPELLFGEIPGISYLLPSFKVHTGGVQGGWHGDPGSHPVELLQELDESVPRCVVGDPGYVRRSDGNETFGPLELPEVHEDLHREALSFAGFPFEDPFLLGGEMHAPFKGSLNEKYCYQEMMPVRDGELNIDHHYKNKVMSCENPLYT